MASLADILETAENQTGGILVVTMPHTLPQGETPKRAFFADNAVNRGPVVERFLAWFPLWGMPLSRTRGRETAFERAFCLTLWPLEEPKNAHGPQFIKATADQVPALLQVIDSRKPRLVIFLSAYLWQSIDQPSVAPLTNAVCGRALEKGRRISQCRLAAWVQRREKCVFLALPQPSKNTTDAAMQSMAQAVQNIFASVRATPDATEDPLLAAAAQTLVLDRALSERRIAAELHVPAARAQTLFASLEGRAWKKDSAGKYLAIFSKSR